MTAWIQYSIKTLCTKERSTEPKYLLHVHFTILYVANYKYCSAIIFAVKTINTVDFTYSLITIKWTKMDEGFLDADLNPVSQRVSEYIKYIKIKN